MAHTSLSITGIDFDKRQLDIKSGLEEFALPGFFVFLPLPIQIQETMQLFEDFRGVSKAEWLEKIANDLKGKDVGSFDWQVAPGQAVSAFPHKDDLGSNLPHPIANGENDWQICEGFQVDNDAAANKLALQALQGGANALRFSCSAMPDFSALLNGIDASIIAFHFKVKKSVGTVDFLQKFTEAAGADPSQLNGSICWQGDQAEALIRFAADSLPNFRVLPVHGSAFFDGDENTVAELKKMAKSANDWFAKLTDIGFSPDEISQRLFFTASIGKNYFLQIAKLRALRKFWLEVQQKWGVANPVPAFVFAQYPLSLQSPDANTNLIQATTQAMSAVVGGVESLTVMPSDMTSGDAQPTDFSRRMARNVQHILKMESHFDWVADPAAGSYFIESLTEKLLVGMRDEG
jgi:methylmalonyl-CoA mutase